MPVTEAELRSLLRDCLAVWGVDGRVEPAPPGVDVLAGGARIELRPAPPALRPLRWTLNSPERRGAGRAPRAVPSITALLTVLRATMPPPSPLPLAGEVGSRSDPGEGPPAQPKPAEHDR